MNFNHLMRWEYCEQKTLSHYLPYLMSTRKASPGCKIIGERERRICMAKAGMRRPDPGDPHGTESDRTVKRRIDPHVPEIEGKAKNRQCKGRQANQTPSVMRRPKNCCSGIVAQIS